MEEDYKLYYCGFIEEKGKEIKFNELTDCQFRQPHAIITPLPVSCSCKIFKDTLLVLTKNFLYYTHGNILKRHSLINSFRKLKEKFEDYIDDEIINTQDTGKQQIKQLHGGSDFVAVLIESGDGRYDALVVREDGDSFTLEIEGRDVEEIVYGKKFGLLRTTDNELIQMDAGWSCEEKINMSPLHIPVNTTIKSMSCGKEHAIILSTDHKVFVLGGATRGQLGNGGTDNSAVLSAVEMLEMLNICEVSAGGWHCLVLSGDGDIYGWGWNESGQVGSSSSSSNSDDGEQSGIEVGQKDCEQTISKLLFLPQLVATPIDETFMSISTGSRHSAAVTSSGVLYTWGWNGYGQLCHGDQDTRFKPSKVMNFLRGKEMTVHCGDWATLICVRP